MNVKLRTLCLLGASMLALAAANSGARAQIGIGVGGSGVGVDIGVGVGSSSVDVDVGVDLGSGLSGVLPPADGGGEGGAPGLGVSGGGVLDHAGAVNAVQQQQAIPLNDLMAIVAQATSGRVIDVQLVLFREALLYQVKVLAADGVVSSLYFYAATGEPVAQEFLNADLGGGG